MGKNKIARFAENKLLPNVIQPTRNEALDNFELKDDILEERLTMESIIKFEEEYLFKEKISIDNINKFFIIAYIKFCEWIFLLKIQSISYT